MSDVDLPILKEQIRKVIFDHLNVLGYPNMTPDQIMNELPAMYNKLDVGGLLRPGMSYMAFVAHANEQALLAHIKGMMGI